MHEDLEKKVEEIVQNELPDESVFIVDLQITGTNILKVAITLDGDQGISIDQCASVSRKVGFILEEDNLIDQKFNLEVSSPGIDQPLKLKRQYKGNVGRRVEVLLEDGNAAGMQHAAV